MMHLHELLAVIKIKQRQYKFWIRSPKIVYLPILLQETSSLMTVYQIETLKILDKALSAGGFKIFLVIQLEGQY